MYRHLRNLATRGRSQVGEALCASIIVGENYLHVQTQNGISTCCSQQSCDPHCAMFLKYFRSSKWVLQDRHPVDAVDNALGDTYIVPGASELNFCCCDSPHSINMSRLKDGSSVGASRDGGVNRLVCQESYR